MKSQRAQVEELDEEDDDEEEKDEPKTDAQKKLQGASTKLALAVGRKDKAKVAKY